MIKKRRGGRKKLYFDRIQLPLAAGVLKVIDSSLKPDEIRLDFIRKAIDRELQRRQQ